MTKRKPRRATDAVRQASSSRSAPASPAAGSSPPAGRSERRRSSSAGRTSKPLLVAGLAVAALAVAGVVWWAMANGASVAQVDRPVGGVYSCRAMPRFVQAQGFGAQAALSTSEKNYTGLVLVEGAGSANPRVYQHPSWTSAGHLAPIQLDREGNVYVVPAPQINVLDNPAEEQNRVYRVDSASGEMARLLDLPAAAPPSAENPFGALGLAYDCDTGSLYVTSVAGSTRGSEVGRIFQVDPGRGQVLGHFDGVDAIGVGVFNGASGKRLYYGLARAPEIWSIALDGQGAFVGEPRLEVSLEDLGPRGDDKARRIRFDGEEMTVHGVEFNFNLVAPTEKQETVYRWGYEGAGWVYHTTD